jgi:hypothetical protein
VLRAYDAKTGTRLWEDLIDRGVEDVGTVIVAIHGHLLFVRGRAGNPHGDDTHFFVRAYDLP